MAIRTKGMHHKTYELLAPGTVTAAADKCAAMVRFPGFITNICAKIKGAGSGATSTIADVHLNGTTIFADATKITFAATTGNVTYSKVTNKPTVVAEGDLLTLDIDQIATSPVGVIVHVTVSRTEVSEPSNDANLDNAF